MRKSTVWFAGIAAVSVAAALDALVALVAAVVFSLPAGWALAAAVVMFPHGFVGRLHPSDSEFALLPEHEREAACLGVNDGFWVYQIIRDLGLAYAFISLVRLVVG